MKGRSSDSVVESGVGLWHEKIYHFKPDKEPSSGGDEIQSEFFIALKDLPEALKDLYELREMFAPVVQVTELRPVKASQVPMSPAYGRDTIGIHFTWVKNTQAVMRSVELIKFVLQKYNYRVHWGKYFGYLNAPYLRQIYGPELDQLAALLPENNPFDSCYIQRLLDPPPEGKSKRCKYDNKFDEEYEKVY